MQAMLLAAGFGKRLRPLTLFTPKPLLPCCNLPILDYLIQSLRDSGVKNFHINTHHLPRHFSNHLNSRYRGNDLKLALHHEKEILGTGGGIKNMIKDIDDEHILVCNADVVHNIDLEKLFNSHIKAKKPITLTLLGDTTLFTQYSLLETDDRGLIKTFNASKPENKKKRGIYSGLMILNKKQMPKFPDQDSFCIVADYLSPLLKEGFEINSFFTNGLWLDFGDSKKYFNSTVKAFKHWDLLPPLKIFFESNFKKIKNGNFVDKNSNYSLEGENSLIGESLSSNEKLRIGSNVFIGNNVTIEGKTLLSNCIILDNTEIENEKRIENKIVGPDSTLEIDNI